MNFYQITSRRASKTLQVESEELYTYKHDNVFHYYKELMRGNFEDIKFPIKFIAESGNRLDDIIETVYPPLLLVSKRFKTIIEDNKFTGCIFYEIKIFTKKGIEIDDYYGISVVGKAGKIDFTKSEIIEKETLSGNLSKYYKGLFFDIATWDGSDFFINESYYRICVSKKVIDVLKANKLTNVDIVDLRFDENLIYPFT